MRGGGRAESILISLLRFSRAVCASVWLQANLCGLKRKAGDEQTEQGISRSVFRQTQTPAPTDLPSEDGTEASSRCALLCSARAPCRCGHLERPGSRWGELA
ncbi:hypothetical protein OJAV_G00158930 [Oryzias javanicus]|uniref:Secreted protein n=1 Tax=Oryzias javanicus TaxID=123683 RepID=A0A437CJ34_ORYJA|nr:hypothetical protein OJAV_G00158930 [Oryzias javanicus]